MAGQRVKGQEVEILMLRNGAIVNTMTAIKSAEITWNLETLDEGFLGEKTNRKDSIFNGITGKVEIELEKGEAFEFTQAIVDKAKRRTPGEIINVKMTLNMPDGSTPRVLIADAEFGEIPTTIGSRADYVTQSYNFMASDARIISTR